MKKPFLLASLLLLSACSSINPSIINGENGYKLLLNRKYLTLNLDAEMALPEPEAYSPNNDDLSNSVEVEVYYENGEIYSPKRFYNEYPLFRPSMPGVYTVFYYLDVDGVELKRSLEIHVSTIYDESIKVDGILDDEKYQEYGEYISGIDGNLKLKMYPSTYGIFVGVEVKDNNMIYSDFVTNRFTQSDGFEVFLDLSSSHSDKLNDACVKFQYSLYGQLRTFTASGNYAYYEMNERIQPVYAVTIDGTPTKTAEKETPRTFYDEDKSYCLEMFVSYDSIGYRPIQDTISFATAHRDICSVELSKIQMNAICNNYKNDISTPDSLYQTLLGNGVDYELRTFEDESITSLYGDFGLKGSRKGFVKNSHVDGEKDTFYGNEKTFNYGSFTLKSSTKFNDEGLYIYLESNDKVHKYNLSDNIFAYDSFTLRICNEKVLKETKFTSANEGLIVSGNLSNQIETSYLAKDNLIFYGLFDTEVFTKINDDGWVAEVFIPSNLLDEKVGLCIGVINNDENYEKTYNDVIFSCDKNNPTKYEVITKEA